MNIQNADPLALDAPRKNRLWLILVLGILMVSLALIYIAIRNAPLSPRALVVKNAGSQVRQVDPDRQSVLDHSKEYLSTGSNAGSMYATTQSVQDYMRAHGE